MPPVTGIIRNCLVLGSLGIFCLYGSCIGAPLAADAIVCLGIGTAIVLACVSGRMRADRVRSRHSFFLDTAAPLSTKSR
jgi:hypothetical protein